MVAASHSNSSYRATKEGGFFLCGNNEGAGATAVLKAGRLSKYCSVYREFFLQAL